MDLAAPILRKSPLRTVVCELRFPARLTAEDDARRLQEVLGANEYPFAEVQPAFLLTPEGALQQQPDVKRYVFSSIDKSRQVLLTPETLALEWVNDYPGWKTFLDAWETVLRAGVTAFELKFQQRIGLRYANQLEADAAAGLGGMAGRLNPTLLSLLTDESGLFSDVRSSFQELRVGREDGVCTIRHGFQVTPDAKGLYLLDFDYYSDKVGEIDPQAQIEQLKSFNFGVWTLFTWCVSAEEYERMEPELTESS